MGRCEASGAGTEGGTWLQPEVRPRPEGMVGRTPLLPTEGNSTSTTSLSYNQQLRSVVLTLGGNKVNTCRGRNIISS